MPLPAVVLAAAAAHSRLLHGFCRLGAAPLAIPTLHSPPRLALRRRPSAAGLAAAAAAAAGAAKLTPTNPELAPDRVDVEAQVEGDCLEMGSSVATMNGLARRLGAEAAEASRTGAFQRLPMIAPSKELLESALRRAARVPYNKKLKNEAQKAKNKCAFGNKRAWLLVCRHGYVAVRNAFLQQLNDGLAVHNRLHFVFNLGHAGIQSALSNMNVLKQRLHRPACGLTDFVSPSLSGLHARSTH